MNDVAETRSSTLPLVGYLLAGAIAIAVGYLSRVHEPGLAYTTTLGYRTVIGGKVALSVVIAVLVLLQLIGALWMYGKLGIKAPGWVGPAHRMSGYAALALSLFVAYLCFMSLGFEFGELHSGEPVPLRAVIHGVVGCLAVGLIITKFMAVRSHSSPRWFLPVTGALLFSSLTLALLTSTGWYLMAKGWPAR